MMRAIWRPFDRLDSLLFGVAVLGMVYFLAGMPEQHPDAALSYRLGEEGAVEAARPLLEQNGYMMDGLEPEAQLMRENDLLTSLQRSLGRPGAVEALKGENGQRLPVYTWSVRWYSRDALQDRGRELRYTVLLNEAGAFWGFDREQIGPNGVNRTAVQTAFLQAGERGAEALALPEALSDSLLEASLSFHAADSLWRKDPATYRTWRGRQVVELLTEASQGEVHVQLGPEAAVALARYHLSQSALASLPLQVDSTWIEEERRDAARVRFVTETPHLGQTVQSEVVVSATGVLLGMETRFNAQPATTVQEQAPDQLTAQVTAEGVADFIKYFMYVVLTAVLLFVFIRRMNARLIDVNAGLRDAAWGGFFAAAIAALTAATSILSDVPNVWIGAAIAGVAVVMAGVSMAVPLFIVSSATDSVAREAWPAKQETLMLVRRAALRNVPVGSALLRGLALSGVLVGLFTAVLMLWPDARLAFGDHGLSTYYLADVSLPIAFFFSTYAVYSLFFCLAVLLGIGTMLYRWRPHLAVVVPGLVVLSIVTKVAATDLEPVGYAWVLAGVLGTPLAIAYWRYDMLTCFVGLLFFGLFVELVPGWVADGLPAQLDFVFSLVLAGLFAVLGLVGVASGRTEDELPTYVPSYVTELAQQERLKRELEIAYQVQESFLPARMPQVEGLDVAAMCLAAQEVGGDYYDVVEIAPGRLGVVIGDVSGKGIQAAFFMTLVKGIWQTLCRSEPSPALVLRRLNELFCANAPRGTFISLIYGVLDVEARTFSFARAGHNPIIYKRTLDRQAQLIRPSGMGIGLTTGSVFDESVEEVTIQLHLGDVLVFYTDGFSEAMNTAREQFGDARLAQRVERASNRPAREILEAISADVHRFSEAAGRHDDMTMVVIKFSNRSGRGRRAAAAVQADRRGLRVEDSELRVEDPG